MDQMQGQLQVPQRPTAGSGGAVAASPVHKSSFDPTNSPMGGAGERRWRDLSEIPENPLQVRLL
jgi:hypothetical protein